MKMRKPFSSLDYNLVFFDIYKFLFGFDGGYRFLSAAEVSTTLDFRFGANVLTPIAAGNCDLKSSGVFQVFDSGVEFDFRT